MALQRGFTAINGSFSDDDEAKKANVKVDTLIFIDGSNSMVRTAPEDGALPLDNGLYANPKLASVDPQTAINTDNIATKVNKSFTDIAIPTALQIGGKYLSTVTNTHTLDDGVTVGDSFIFTWSSGTIATINAVSNMKFTNREGVTSSHTTRIFDFPIVQIQFDWDGSAWGVK